MFLDQKWCRYWSGLLVVWKKLIVTKGQVLHTCQLGSFIDENSILSLILARWGQHYVCNFDWVPSKKKGLKQTSVSTMKPTSYITAYFEIAFNIIKVPIFFHHTQTNCVSVGWSPEDDHFCVLVASWSTAVKYALNVPCFTSETWNIPFYSDVHLRSWC